MATSLGMEPHHRLVVLESSSDDLQINVDLVIELNRYAFPEVTKTGKLKNVHPRSYRKTRMSFVCTPLSTSSYLAFIFSSFLFL